MKRCSFSIAIILLSLCTTALQAQRVRWETSKVVGSPDPQPPVPMTEELVDLTSVMDSITRRELDFGVSADEEYIELTVRVGQVNHSIPPRVHHELLLVLARRRGVVPRGTGAGAQGLGTHRGDAARPQPRPCGHAQVHC